MIEAQVMLESILKRVFPSSSVVVRFELSNYWNEVDLVSSICLDLAAEQHVSPDRIWNVLENEIAPILRTRLSFHAGFLGLRLEKIPSTLDLSDRGIIPPVRIIVAPQSLRMSRFQWSRLFASAQIQSRVLDVMGLAHELITFEELSDRTDSSIGRQLRDTLFQSQGTSIGTFIGTSFLWLSPFTLPKKRFLQLLRHTEELSGCDLRLRCPQSSWFLPNLAECEGELEQALRELPTETRLLLAADSTPGELELKSLFLREWANPRWFIESSIERFERVVALQEGGRLCSENYLRTFRLKVATLSSLFRQVGTHGEVQRWYARFRRTISEAHTLLNVGRGKGVEDKLIEFLALHLRTVSATLFL